MGLKDRMKDVAAKGATVAKDQAQAAMERRAEAKEAERVAPAQPQAAGVIFRGMSHESGRNAEVVLFRDRIERTKERSRASLSKAAQDTEVIPVRAVTSVVAKKDGLRTHVAVVASANTIDFRFGHDEAQRFKDALMEIVLDDGSPAPQAAAADPLDQIRKLGELRDAGLLSAEEFDAKKAQILERM